MKVSDNVYKFLKWIGLIAIPAVSVFLRTIGPALGWEPSNVDNIVTIANATGLFIGALVGASTYNYNRTDTLGE